MLLRELAGVLAAKRPLPRQELLVHDRQAVLVAGLADFPAKGLRRRVQRRHAAQQTRVALALQVLHQAKIGYFHAVADEEEIAWLDVKMLEIMLFIHVVE